MIRALKLFCGFEVLNGFFSFLNSIFPPFLSVAFLRTARLVKKIMIRHCLEISFPQLT